MTLSCEKDVHNPLLAKPASPIRPMPIKIMVAGSETKGVVVALMTTGIARKNASIGTAVG